MGSILSEQCGKTLGVARMEVPQEEEIYEMKRQHTNLQNLQEAEDDEIRRMEELEEKDMLGQLDENPDAEGKVKDKGKLAVIL